MIMSSPKNCQECGKDGNCLYQKKNIKCFHGVIPTYGKIFEFPDSL